MAIAEFELTSPLQSLTVPEGYSICQILIRREGKPLGWISVTINDSCIPIGTLLNETQKQLGVELLHTVMQQQYQQASEELPPVSVIVCTRDRTGNLKTCLQHLLAIDYPKFEIVVVDNAPSDDQTYELAKRLPVKYVREEKPGLNNARNRGIKESIYDIVAFTDDDVRVDAGWLRAVAANFCNEEVMAVTGYVAPARLDTEAEQLFELRYGGMGHGFWKRHFSRQNITAVQLLWASGMGVGANMAYRKNIFQVIGDFDPALDVGTPTRGGGDIEMFHRVVSNNHLLIYDPSALVWHQHRKDMASLRRQVSDNGRGFGAYLITALAHKRVSLLTWLLFISREWFMKWVVRNLVKRRIPPYLLLSETIGFLQSGFAFLKSRGQEKKRLKNQNRLAKATILVANA